MADDVTWFSLEAIPEGWFAPELKPDGWFDRALLDSSAAGGDVNITGASTLGAIAAASALTVLIAVTGASQIGNISASSEVRLPIAVSGASGIGAFTQTSDVTVFGTAAIPRGDDATYSRKRPIVTPRPKLEREIDAVLELVETAQVESRTGARRKIVKQAAKAISEISAPFDFAPAVEAVKRTLQATSRAAAVHEGVKHAISNAALELEAVLAKMEAKRLKRRREEEIVVSWLLK